GPCQRSPASTGATGLLDQFAWLDAVRWLSRQAVELFEIALKDQIRRGGLAGNGAVMGDVAVCAGVDGSHALLAYPAVGVVGRQVTDIAASQDEKSDPFAVGC